MDDTTKEKKSFSKRKDDAEKLFKGYIKAQGLTQASVAEKLRIDTGAFSRKIRGRDQIKPIEVTNFCRLLGLSDEQEEELQQLTQKESFLDAVYKFQGAFSIRFSKFVFSKYIHILIFSSIFWVIATVFWLPALVDSHVFHSHAVAKMFIMSLISGTVAMVFIGSIARLFSFTDSTSIPIKKFSEGLISMLWTFLVYLAFAFIGQSFIGGVLAKISNSKFSGMTDAVDLALWLPLLLLVVIIFHMSLQIPRALIKWVNNRLLANLLGFLIYISVISVFVLIDVSGIRNTYYELINQVDYFCLNGQDKGSECFLKSPTDDLRLSVTTSGFINPNHICFSIAPKWTKESSLQQKINSGQNRFEQWPESFKDKIDGSCNQTSYKANKDSIVYRVSLDKDTKEGFSQGQSLYLYCEYLQWLDPPNTRNGSQKIAMGTSMCNGNPPKIKIEGKS